MYEQIHRPMLQRLETADRAAKLLTRFEVFDGGVEQRLAEPEQVSPGQQLNRIPRAR